MTQEKKVKMNSPQMKTKNPTTKPMIRLHVKRAKGERLSNKIVIKKMNQVRSAEEKRKVFKSQQRKKKKLILLMSLCLSIQSYKIEI